MDPQHLTIMATTFQSVLDATTLNERGHQLEFVERERLFTPFRLGLSVVASMATEYVMSIADLHRQCNDLWNVGASYKGCYNQWLKPSGPELFRHSLCPLMGQLTRKGLGFAASQALSECKRLVIHDGSSFALHDALAKVFPGRFNTVQPAAVALPCMMAVRQDAPSIIALSPDTDADHDYRPEPASLRGDLFLADRGALDVAYVRDMDRQGGSFIVRAQAGLHPRVLTALREAGKRLKSCQDRELQAMGSQFPKQQRSELEVEWLIEGEPCRLRLLVRWNPQTPSLDDL